MTERARIATIAKANGEFLHRLYPKMVQANGEDANLVLSPFSISIALAMAMAGARGFTRDEMAHGLCLGSADDIVIWEGYACILEELRSTENITFEAVNKLYVEQTYPLLSSFIETTKRYFQAEAENVDFANGSDSACEAINAFVEEKTSNKIKNLISSDALSSLTSLVLINAVYFKGNWAGQFKMRKTKKRQFSVNKEHQVSVAMMKKSDHFNSTFNEELNAEVLEIPFKGYHLSMYIFLSSQPEGFQAMERNLHLVDFSQLEMSHAQKCKLLLPRFKLESSHDLGNSMKSLGVQSMFEEGKADFSGMVNEKDLSLSKAIQKAFIEVNEKGSEAAGATATIACLGDGPKKPKRKDFICDRPFLFFIVTKGTKLVIFSGRVMDPSKN